MGERRTGLILLLIICFAVISILHIWVVKAEPKTIVVPDQFKTIQAAVDYASDGDIVFVRNGTYKGALDQTLVLDKSISLIGENPRNTHLFLQPRWVEPDLPFTPPYYENAITIQDNNVRLSNFTVSSIGGWIVTFGNGTQISSNILELDLFLRGSHENVFRNNSTTYISSTGSYSNISHNILIGGQIVIGVEGTNCSVNNNFVFNGNGIGVVGNGNRIFNNSVENCSFGIIISGPAASNNTVYTNYVYNNTVGLSVASEGNNNILFDNYVINNRFGAEVRYYFPVGENNTLYRNNFVDNTWQVNTDSTIMVSGAGEWTAYHSGFFDNGEEGNYWSDYNGIDSDGDGIGDTPYIIDKNRADNYPLMKPAEIEVIPEFPSWIILPLMLIVTLVGIIIRKKFRSSRPHYRSQ